MLFSGSGVLQAHRESNWEITDKRGTRYFFGSNSSSRQDDGPHVFRWCLDRIEDLNGNYVHFSYTKHKGEIYLDRANTRAIAGLGSGRMRDFPMGGNAR